jgi:TonB family protein
MFRRTWPAIFVIMVSAGGFAVSTSIASLRSVTLEQREHSLRHSFARASQFADVPHISASRACEEAQAPEALATPNPLFTPAAQGRKVKVSFIIGTDGRVHSPLILESGGMIGDWHVLRTVRTWRYRPATCNGVPTETEGKIEFSSR